MANLGNLYFSVQLKDLTDEQIKDIRKKLENLDCRVDARLNFDKAAFRQSMTDFLSRNVFKAKIDVSDSLRDSVRKAYESVSVGKITTPSDVRSQRIMEIQERMSQRAALSQERLRLAQIRTTAATERLRSSSSALNRTFRSQSGIVGQLGDQISNMFSVYSLERFAGRLIEIGGQFQTHHIALKAMLGDAAKADAIFGKIKGLAIESPYTFMDLASYTKQLAAFSIPYNELYDTTKRLADISAGLGVDMGRIILAYGQVRSAAFLRGQEVRQFTEAGIPLLDALAKKFTELEGRVVSVGEVFEKISSREVPFEMVKEVLWDMTNEGGQFFNMQERLVESLSGKYEKLKDSLQIMLSEIANSGNSVLGGGLDLLTSFTDRWKDLVQVLGAVVAGIGLYKAIIIASNAITAVAIVRKKTFSTAAQIAAQSIAGETAAMATLNAQSARMITGVNRLKTAFLGLGKGGWAGIIIGALGAIGTAIYTAYHRANRLKNELAEIDSEAGANEMNLISGYRKLIRELGDATEGTKAYSDIIKQINSSYGQYLDGLYSEAEAYDKVRESVDSVTQAIINKSRQQAYEKKVSAIEEDYAERFQDTENALSQDIRNLFKKLDKETSRNMASSIASLLRGGKSIDQAWGLVLEDYRKAVEKALGRNLELGDFSIFKPVNMDESKVFGSLLTYENLLKSMGAELDKAAQSQAGYTIYGNHLDEIKKKWEDINKNSSLTNDEKRLNLIKMYREQLDFLTGKNVPKKDPVYENIEAQIAALERLDEAWVKTTNDIMGKGTKLSLTDAYMSNPVSYLEMLAEEYEKSKEKIGRSGLLGDMIGGDEGVKRQLDAAQETVSRIEKLGEKLGVDISAFGKKESGKKKDPAAEEWKKRIELLKDAASDYDKLSKKYGKNTAQQMLSGNPLFSDLGEGFDFSQSKEVLRNFIKEISKKASGEQQENVVAEGLRILLSFELDTNSMAKVREDIDKTIDNWDIYKKLFDATGDKGLSSKLAFNDIQIWDEAAEALRNDLFTKMGTLNLSQEENLFSQTEEEARDFFGTNGELFELWKAIKKRIEENGVNLKINTADAFTAMQTLPDKIRAKEAEKADALKGLDKGTPEYTKVSDMYDAQISDLKAQAFEASEAFKQFFTGAVEEGGIALLRLRDEARDLLKLIEKGDPIKDADGNVTGYKFTDKAGNEQTISTTGKDKLTGFLNNDNLKGVMKLTDKIKDAFDKGGMAAAEAIAGSVGLLSDWGASISNDLGSVFSAFGNDGAAAKAELAGGIFSGLSNMADFTNPASIIKGITGIITSVAQFHDNKLQKEIEDSEFEVKKLQNAYKNLQSTIENQLGSVTQAQAREMQENLHQQSEEMKKQMELEEEKSNTDDEKLEDMKQQYHDALEAERNFTKELAESQYGVNLKDWSSQIADSLVDAFASGEDAAKAFDDTVADIMKSVISNMINLSVLQPAMDKLRKTLFGEDGLGGIFGVNSAGGTSLTNEEAVILGESLAGLRGAIDNSKEIWDYVSDAMEKVGVDISDLNKENSLTKGIEGVTEDTASLLASYINAMRADLSANRLTLERLVNEHAPQMSVIAQAQLTQLKLIADNTSRNADFAEEIRDILQRNINGGNMFHIK